MCNNILYNTSLIYLFQGTPQSNFTFSLVNIQGTFASTYFRVDSQGDIFVRVPLTEDNQNTPTIEVCFYYSVLLCQQVLLSYSIWMM